MIEYKPIIHEVTKVIHDPAGNPIGVRLATITDSHDAPAPPPSPFPQLTRLRPIITKQINAWNYLHVFRYRLPK